MLGIACLVMCLAFGLSAWMIISVANSKRVEFENAHQFEKARRVKVRAASTVYRNFEPAIDEIGKLVQEQVNEDTLNSLSEVLAVSGLEVPWKSSEFAATKILESSFVGLLAYFFLNFILGYDVVSSVVLAVGFSAFFYWMSVSSVQRKAAKRRRIIKRDFAAAIDLLALMMEVGGGFLDSLKVVASEYSGKSLGTELSTIVNDVELGKPRKQAMESFANRMLDDDVSEVVFACNESEELGVPISETLRDQADRIRQKRSSWAEQAAQEAEVSLTFPAMIIMIACLITVGAPFILSGLQQWKSSF